jgi:uncharacterized membrane protein YdbT with pleckstrin-like domain
MDGKARLIPRKFLSSDEKVVLETRPSAWLHMKAGGLVLLLGLVSLVLFVWNQVPDLPAIPYVTSALADESYGQYLQYALLALFVLATIFFFAKYLEWNGTIYAVTDERVIVQRGILSKTYEDMPLTMITNVDMAQALSHRALGYGTLIFSTSGTGSKKTNMVWEAVPDPMTARRKVQEVMDVRVKPGQRSE